MDAKLTASGHTTLVLSGPYMGGVNFRLQLSVMLNNSYNFALLLGATRTGREDIHSINAFNDIMEKQYAALRELIENLVGRKMQTPRDFDFLALYIWGTLHTHISPTTLKRFWGYLPSSTDATPRISTLDILASLAGYKRWSHYLEQTRNGACVDSGFTCDKFLYTRTLPEGTHLQLTWQPARQVCIRLEGQDLFVVVASVGSKLSVGDTFICPCFVQGEPLHLHCLRHEGGAPTDYVCGKMGGIRYKVIEKPTLKE